MRSDKNLDESFRRSDDWSFRLEQFDISMTTVSGMDPDDLPEARRVSHSFSGHERNHLFRNVEGRRFDDISPISGLDHPGDSRGFCLLDFDRDGWIDVAMINANRPTFQLYRNQLGDLGVTGNFIAVRFVGGNRSAEKSRLSCRDGYGARVRARIGDVELVREHRCGDGFAAQNSDTMILGIGPAERVDEVIVEWPSGRDQTVERVDRGMLVVAREEPDSEIGEAAFEVLPYGPAIPVPAEGHAARRPGPVLSVMEPCDRPTLFITMATWCEACVRHLPQVERLVRSLGDDEVRIAGVPIDGGDDQDELAAWRERFRPAYELIPPLDEERRGAVEGVISGWLPDNALPSSILTDEEGRVLHVWAGIPTVSDIRQKLERALWE